MQDRILIRADNWRFRAFIADYGRYPDVYELRDGLDENGLWQEEPLPERGAFGYEVAYLQVFGRITGNRWDTGEYTICATCAESDRPDMGDDFALLPLLQINAEITGNYDTRVVRCEGCNAIICDYETLEMVAIDPSDGSVETQSYMASAYDEAITHAKELAATLGYQSCVTDAERHLDEYVTGEAWPVEIIATIAPLRYLPRHTARQYPLFIA